jgi:hypothetical protein
VNSWRRYSWIGVDFHGQENWPSAVLDWCPCQGPTNGGVAGTVAVGERRDPQGDQLEDVLAHERVPCLPGVLL